MLHKLKTIVFISGAWPDRSKGYSIANLATLDFFSNRIEQCIYLGPSDDYVNQNIQKDYKRVDFVPSGFERKPKSIRFVKSLFSKYPAITERFWKDFSRVESEISIRCKFEESETLFFYEDIPSAYLIFYLKKRFPGAKHFVRSHNVVYKGFSGLSKSQGLIKKIAWNIELKKIKKFEKKVFGTADKFYAISNEDASIYREDLDIIPDGIVDFFIDVNRYRSIGAAQNNIIYLGSADLRKAQALQKFIQESWPIIQSKNAKTKLLLAGRNTEQFHNPPNRVYGYGFIESEIEFLQKGSVFINPQLSGAGIKIKSLIALAASKLLVTTKIGAEGTGIENGVHCVIENNFYKQAEIINSFLQKKENYFELIQAGRDYVFNNFKKEHFYKKMYELFDSNKFKN